MKLFKRVTLLALALALTLGLSACAAGPEMPMEATIDGHTITLGKTTMADMADWGYEVYSAGRQDAAREGDKYIYFHYSLSKGAGNQFWVSVYTPYYGGTNINKEADEAAESGIVFAVTLSKSATEKISASYNGVDIKDMSFDSVAEWGCKKDEEASVATYKLTAAQGFITCKAEGTFSEEMDELRVSMEKKTFEAMQK